MRPWSAILWRSGALRLPGIMSGKATPCRRHDQSRAQKTVFKRDRDTALPCYRGTRTLAGNSTRPTVKRFGGADLPLALSITLPASRDA
jgi:hypothetical protein